MLYESRQIPYRLYVDQRDPVLDQVADEFAAAIASQIAVVESRPVCSRRMVSNIIGRELIVGITSDGNADDTIVVSPMPASNAKVIYINAEFVAALQRRGVRAPRNVIWTLELATMPWRTTYLVVSVE